MGPGKRVLRKGEIHKGNNKRKRRNEKTQRERGGGDPEEEKKPDEREEAILEGVQVVSGDRAEEELELLEVLLGLLLLLGRELLVRGLRLLGTGCGGPRGGGRCLRGLWLDGKLGHDLGPGRPRGRGLAHRGGGGGDGRGRVPQGTFYVIPLGHHRGIELHEGLRRALAVLLGRSPGGAGRGGRGPLSRVLVVKGIREKHPHIGHEVLCMIPRKPRKKEKKKKKKFNCKKREKKSNGDPPPESTQSQPQKSSSSSMNSRRRSKSNLEQERWDVKTGREDDSEIGNGHLVHIRHVIDPRQVVHEPGQTGPVTSWQLGQEVLQRRIPLKVIRQIC